MKLSRTTNYNFGWLLLIGLVDVAFLLVFFLLLSSNFILQQGISVSMPFSRYLLSPQTCSQIISITAAASARCADYALRRRRSHAVSLDRCGRSGACFHNSSSTGNKAPCAAKDRARAVLFRD